MKILKLTPNTSGAYPPIQDGQFSKCPIGFVMIPEDLDTTVFDEYSGFVSIQTHGNVVTSMTPNTACWESWKNEMNIAALDNLRDAKIKEVRSNCNNAILAGVDVTTTVGVEHFSLQETDQINLSAALQAVQQGAESYPYHADKQLCRMFTADEIIQVVDAATKHKVYHTTLCNHLLVWIRRAETVEELENISYSAENLPQDLATNMDMILNSSSEPN